MAPAPPRPITLTMVFFGLLYAGAITIDRITDSVLPITARHFTDNIALIGFMVALHRVCGCFVQPFAAWQSDRHRSPAGRRRPFFLWSLPATLVATGLIGATPFLVPVDSYRSVAVVVTIVLLNLWMQVAQAVTLGCADPLYGDTFKPGDLGRAGGIRGCVVSSVNVLMAYIAIPLADHNEFLPYAFAMGFLVIAWTIVIVCVRENVPVERPAPATYNPWRPLAELRDPHYARVATIAAATLVAEALTLMLHALFVTETLHLSKTDLGRSTALGIVVAFVFSYPAGILVDRFGPRAVLIFGYTVVGLAGLSFVFFVHDAIGLYLAAVPLAIGRDCINVPNIPIVYRYAPPERRGSIFAAVQTVRAASAFVITVVVGQIAHSVGSYRVCYVAAAIVCVIGVVAAWNLSSPQAVSVKNETVPGKPRDVPSAQNAVRN